MSNDVLITLMKEVVKNEVKKQVKEELAKLIKSGAITLNKKKPSSLMGLTEVNATAPIKKQTVNPTQKTSQPVKTFTNNPILNEVLNSTSPFSAEERSSGAGLSAMMGGSLLDMVQRESEDEWGTIKMNSNNLGAEPIPQPTVESTGNESLDLLNKALNRDYTELVKRFK